MPLKHTRRRALRPDFVNGGALARHLELEESDHGCVIRLVPTLSSVMAAMGTSLSVVTAVMAAAALALVESRGASDPFFLVLAVSAVVAASRFIWLHMSRETIRVEGPHLEHHRSLLGLGSHHHYAADCIGNLRLDRPTGGVVRFECRGRVARMGFGLNAEVSRRLLEMLEAQLVRVGHLPRKG